MKPSRIVILAQIGLLSLTMAVKAQEQVTVSPKMDIFKAGGYDDGSNGETPALYAFTAKSGRAMAFSAVLGVWDCLDGAPYYGPDGTMACPPFSIPGPVGTFAGYEQTDFQGSMVGMFLEDRLPEFAPPTLRFYVSDFLRGGIPTDFRYIAPKIGQVFFIGDGRRGTLSGDFQLFAVPETATRLYLGYVDSCTSSADSIPGCYSDNSGGMTVVFKFYDSY